MALLAGMLGVGEVEADPGTPPSPLAVCRCFPGRLSYPLERAIAACMLVVLPQGLRAICEPILTPYVPCLLAVSDWRAGKYSD